ncbi:MAG: AarF/UbiB family protein [Lentisphaeria bacterium]|nr:AarF/UbiB family protein [Lentisphaeria bacterium]
MKLLSPIISTYQTYVNMTRMRKILGVLFRNGLGMFFGRFRNLVKRSERNSVENLNLTIPQRLRKALEELGPVYVKFASELANLQNNVQPFPFSQVKETIEHELDAPLDELFADFSEKPFAAASLAQGHRATLKDGTQVFVKIQRPNAWKDIKADMRMLVFLADHLHESYPELRFLMLPRIARRFQKSIQEEVDYNNEKGNIHRFAEQFKDNPNLHVPKVFEDYSTAKILTMEFISGIKADHVDELRAAGLDPVKLSEIGADLFLKQFFTYGFFHADPHPGNIFILPDGKFCYIDFGLCGRISKEEQMLFCRLMMSILERDEQHAAQILLRLCDYETEPDMAELECTVGEFIDRYFYGELSKLDVPEAISQIFMVCNQMHIALKPHIYMMLKALGTLDGLGRKLNPEYNLEKQLRPAMMKVATSHFRPTKSIYRRMEDVMELFDIVSRTPGGLRAFANKLMTGQLSFRQELPDLREFMKVYSRTQTQRNTVLLSAAVMINSTLLLAFKIPPVWHGTSILGAIGLAGGIFMAAFCLFDLMRNK